MRTGQPSDVTTPPTPWPAPKDAPVLLFGGSFDPPHRAHAEIAPLVRDRVLGAHAWLVLVPAARSPHKAGGPSAPDDDRRAMLALAFAGVERVAVWTDELDRAVRGEPSYWVDTLERARRARGSLAGARFLIGADQARAFGRWRRAHDIEALCEPVVVPRGDVTTIEDLHGVVDAGAWARRWVDLPTRAESSTRVRTRGRFDDLHPDVAAYIGERGLYADRA